MGKSVKEGIMPKEYVRAVDYNFVPAPEGTTLFPKENRLGAVEIGWQKYPNGHVEIGTGDEALIRSLIEDVRAAVDNATAAETGAAAADAISHFFVSPALWVSLDRDGCNQLIKKIRKARDDAFGRDE
jgi:hypothetical protein